jgi:MFS family permease
VTPARDFEATAAQHSAATPNSSPWDTRYEWRTIALLTLASGLLGLDRFIVNPLFPAMMRDLSLDYQDLGNMGAVLAVTWGLCALLMGRVSDRVGRRRVIIPSIVVFSLLVGVTGLVGGLASLLVVRAIMGVAEGACVPAANVAAIEASKPTRKGFNFGIFANGLPLIGLGLGPILATQLLFLLPSWRWVFAVAAIPGLVTAYLLHRVLRDTRVKQNASITSRHEWKRALRTHNVPLCVLVMACTSGALNVVIAMTPNYLTDHLHLPVGRMGFIMSAVGAGAFLGGLTLPGLSDRFGRKPVMLFGVLAAAVSLWAFTHAGAGATEGWLFALLLSYAMFAFSAFVILIGPMATESVEVSLASTAVGIISGVGEIVGGGAAPALAGYIAKHFGIEKVFYTALVALILALLLINALHETRTRGLERSPGYGESTKTG